MEKEDLLNKETETKEDSYYTISEVYKLPSGGEIYSTPFNPTVKLRSMTVMEEMKRMSKQDGTNQNLCEIVDSCLVTKLPVSCYDMHIADYEYLVHKLRVVTYGPEYKMIVGCPHTLPDGSSCGCVENRTFNLDEMEVKDFDLVEFENSLKFTLPRCKKEIKLKMYTPRLEDTITRLVKERELELEKIGATNTMDYTPLVTLQCLIDTVDGEKLTYIQSKHFIEQMSAGDYNVILQKIEKNKTMLGLNKQINVICRKCGKAYKTFFRFGQEFYRPTQD